MGLISKLEEKLSGNKNHSTTEEQRLREQQEIDSTRTPGTASTPHGGLTGEGSHLGHGTSTGGVTGTSHGTHGTTTGSHNPLSSSNDAYGTTGHSGLTGSTHGTHGSTTGSHNPLSTSNNTHGTSGITGGTHPLVSGNDSSIHDSGIGANTHHTGTGLGHNTHGNGLTGGSTTGSNTIGASHRHEAGDIGSRGSVPGAHSTGMHHTAGPGGASTEKTTAHQPYDPFSSKGQRIAADAVREGTHGTHGSSLTNHNSADFVPGSHPAANNPSAIPTAGGKKVGGVGEGIGHSSHHTGAHQTTGDKLKNALPGQHGNAHDAYGNPINVDHTTSAGLTGGAHSGVGGSTHGSSGLTGTHGSSGLTGTHGHPGSNFNSSSQPLGHDPSFTDRHSGPGAGTGLAAGAAGGVGLAGASHHHNDPTRHSGSGLTGNTHGSGLGSNVPGAGYGGAHQDEYTRGQAAAYQQHQGGLGNTSSSVPGAYPEADNRTMMEKAKDKLSSKRTDYPDDPVTGTNYTQQSGGAPGITGSHDYAGQPGVTGSHAHNNNLYGSHSSGGISGITQGVDNTHLGSQYPQQTGYGHGLGPQQHQQPPQQHQQQHSLGGAGAGMMGGGNGSSQQHHSVEGRGAAYEAGFKDAVAALSRQGQ
ncbi:hypothetical protein CERZMDRAFT_99510 [Cercospora zeae-maydis SCOH1-5]|uniref:Uncharacterized protein n=1 Tax=Cercospora zeae-maydis SCOH1-5 TaxID=717836 RepID=A0A6A6FAJ1_9PEZI|nr:hypothetical protein CERZMDRAFT_99510 [Cercospora zeae-maydis SCOH1-5]